MKIILTSLLIIFISISSIGQRNHSKNFQKKELHQKNKNFYGDSTFNTLNLTNDQKAQIEKVNESFKQQMQDLHKNTSVPASDFKEKRMALIKEHKEKMNAILTSEQRTQMDNLEQNFAKERKGQMQGGRSNGMMEKLNLTPEQSAKMKDLSAELESSAKSIHEDTTLSRDEKRNQMRQLMQKHKADMENLLTDDQKEQLKKSAKNKRPETI